MPDIEASFWIPYTDDGKPLPFLHRGFAHADKETGAPLQRSISPRDVCTQAADAIQGLLRSYSQLYTLRRTPSFVPYFVLTSSIMHLAIAASKSAQSSAEDAGGDVGGRGAQTSHDKIDGADGAAVRADPRVVTSINQGISDLTEMAPCHHFAEQALNILRYLAKKWNIEIDIDVGQSVAKNMADEYQSGGNTRDRELRMMKNHEYATRPVTQSLNFFAPNFREQDFVSKWGSESIPASSDNPPVAKSGEAMENPLFWPFPMQGRPMLPSGSLLKEAGFQLL
ncbi:Nitrogen assimilation transcription factor nit-4 [Cytospora mali]|uniref:Nitrogen assimilation transcription factor nit-4 n=1 Tax=Cytospora mali TaxID=578113 RepID=A0A194URK5_CYTMA|nr:Nitrogen assimilation transcription factor nit-4 [Valsa mali var. pyri (nom. inval.)]